MKTCRICGSQALDSDEKCGICGNDLREILPDQAQPQHNPVEVPRASSQKARITILVLIITMFLSGILILVFREQLTIIGALLLLASIAMVMLIIGTGPSPKMRGYGYRSRRWEREAREEQEKEESD